MFTHLPQIEPALAQLVAQQRYNDALGHIVVGVHHHYKTPEVAHKALYYPVLDALIQQLADALEAQCEPASAEGSTSGNTLIVASELYETGGHSRVVDDVAHALKSTTIVLTDTFAYYARNPHHLDWVLATYEDATVIVLQQQTLWAKARALRNLTQRLNPGNILYFNHHQDAVPFVGTLTHRGSRKTLIHHSDHNPSVGCTLAGVAHVDFTDELAEICTKALQRDAKVLPLYVPDSGLKSFSPIAGQSLSVVMSGTAVKFQRGGELALQDIAQTALSSIRGQFFHIGPLAEDWLAEIKAHLQQQDIDPARFVALGQVTSLWQTLQSIDAHLYIGSAPVGGGRAAIEAQGCGYPLAFYRVGDPGSLVAADSIYASQELGWANLAELSALLNSVGPQHAAWSTRARSCYEQRFSREQFLRVLGEIVGR